MLFKEYYKKSIIKRVLLRKARRWKYKVADHENVF